jgi:dihydroxyacetone synthase
MAPSLEHFEEATSGIPVKVLGTQIDGTNGAATLQLEEADKHDQVLRVFRCLIADLCEQFGGGHPGGKSSLRLSTSPKQD